MKITSSLSKRLKILRKPLSLRNSRSIVRAHPTHRSMAAKIGLDAALPPTEQRDTLAAAAAAVGCHGLNFNHPSR